ncbi:MAG: sugar transferase [Candidatus Odinarchaeota archaeon]
MNIYRIVIKPIIDFTISLIAIILISPIFLLIFCLLYIYNNGSPFFLQSRPGLNGKIFKVIKFKTMNDKKDENGILLPDNQRITSLGKFIRHTSLDELPQLINILKGDMSLVGPRPLLIEYLPLYNNFQKRRHEVKPGITGLAQVKGRNAISWDEKFKYDVFYVDHISFIMDIKILWLTLLKVIKREGIGEVGSKVGSVVFDYFEGNIK